MKILVIGVHGFVGGAIGRAAYVRGHSVVGLARPLQAPEVWRGDYFSLEVSSSLLLPALERFRPEVIFHCVGSASVGRSFEDPVDDFQASAGTLVNLLDAVRRSSLRPLVLFPSSAAVYGNPISLPVSEVERLHPISPYGYHKLTAEIVAESFVRCFGLRVCCCRLFSVFGAAQRRLLVWELYQAFAGESAAVELQGTGEETRDYLHIDDVASAMLDLADGLQPQPISAQPWVFNIASGASIKVSALAALIRECGGWDKPVAVRGVARIGDPQHWCADVSKLHQLLPHWHPEPMATRLRETIQEWIRLPCR